MNKNGATMVFRFEVEGLTRAGFRYSSSGVGNFGGGLDEGWFLVFWGLQGLHSDVGSEIIR